jgi:hypothetical protein
MKYKDKKYNKIKKKLKKYKSGDGDEEIYNPFERQIGSLLTHGKSKGVKSVNISHKKRVGNVVNKDMDNRYNSVKKTIDRMNNSRSK